MQQLKRASLEEVPRLQGGIEALEKFQQEVEYVRKKKLKELE